MNNITKKIIRLWRWPLTAFYKARLRNRCVSIISSNCLAGVMYHDAKLKFLSPTINLTIKSFISFVENIDEYLSLDMIKHGYDSLGRPLGLVGDIIVKGHHYKTEDELSLKWNERRKRVCKNIFIVATDEAISSKDDERRFDSLPFPKICFISKQPSYSWQIYLPEFKKENCVGDCMRYRSIIGKRIFEKHFNFVKWLNSYYNK